MLFLALEEHNARATWPQLKAKEKSVGSYQLGAHLHNTPRHREVEGGVYGQLEVWDRR